MKDHLREVLRGAIAGADGDKDLSWRLHAETKLRLMVMSDEELQELAKLTSPLPERPVRQAYKEIKKAIEEHRPTAGKWINDLVKESVLDKEETG